MLNMLMFFVSTVPANYQCNPTISYAMSIPVEHHQKREAHWIFNMFKVTEVELKNLKTAGRIEIC